MATPEEIELGRRVNLYPQRTAYDYIRCLADFLAVTDERRGHSVSIEYDQRFYPLKIQPDLLLYPANRDIIRSIRRAYHNPTESVASDKLKRFFDLVLEPGQGLPQIAKDNNREVSWFYQRRRGYWATIIGNLIADESGVGIGRWPSSSPFTVTAVGGGGGGGGVPGLHGIPTERLNYYRNLLQTASIFGVQHDLTKVAIQNLIRDLEYTYGRRRGGETTAAQPPQSSFTFPPPPRCSTRR